MNRGRDMLAEKDSLKGRKSKAAFKMINQKKGAEAIVVWILLIGLTVALTTTVFLFEKKTAKNLVGGNVDYMQSTVECNDVSVNLIKCTGQGYVLCGTCNNPTLCKVDVMNSGRISIAGLLFRDNVGNKAEYGTHKGDNVHFPMEPGDVQTPFIKKKEPLLDINNGLELIPLISISNKIYACTNKKMKVSSYCSLGCQQ